MSKLNDVNTLEGLAIQGIIMAIRAVRRKKVVSKKTDAKLAAIEDQLDDMIGNKLDNILDLLDKVK